MAIKITASIRILGYFGHVTRRGENFPKSVGNQRKRKISQKAWTETAETADGARGSRLYRHTKV